MANQEAINKKRESKVVLLRHSLVFSVLLLGPLLAIANQLTIQGRGLAALSSSGSAQMDARETNTIAAIGLNIKDLDTENLETHGSDAEALDAKNTEGVVPGASALELEALKEKYCAELRKFVQASMTSFRAVRGSVAAECMQAPLQP